MTPRNTLLRHRCYHGKFGHYGSHRHTTGAYLLGSSGKVLPFASQLSRSLKVIGTDMDRSTAYDFLLKVFYSNYGQCAV